MYLFTHFLQCLMDLTRPFFLKWALLVFFFYFCFILFFCLGKKGAAPKPGVFEVHFTPGLNHPGPHLLGRRVPDVTPVQPAEITAAAWQVNEKESQNLRVLCRYSTLLLCLVAISGSCDANPWLPAWQGSPSITTWEEQSIVPRDENSLLQEFF